MQPGLNEEIDLREYLAVIQKHRKLIAYSAFGLALLVLIFSLMQKPVYEAKATILIKSGSVTSASSKYDTLASLAGISLPTGGSSLMDLTMILQSRAVAEKVLDDLKLTERIKGWDNPDIKKQSLIGTVQGMLRKPKNEGNLVELKVAYNDPELAMELANGFANALSYYCNKLSYTEARKKKEYIESQLPRVEKDLKKAEHDYKMMTLLSASSKTISQAAPSVDVARLARELEIQNSVYAMLRQQYETVKLEEAKEIPPFSVVDWAVKPEAKSGPKTKRNVLIGLTMGLLAGVFTAFFREYWEKSGKR